MEKKTKLVEVRTLDGEVFLRALVSEQEVTPEDTTNNTSNRTGSKKRGRDQKEGKPEWDPMTDAQKRYLFRIVDEQKGLEGERAEAHLKKLFSVESLEEISKVEASKMIESLLESGKKSEENEASSQQTD